MGAEGSTSARLAAVGPMLRALRQARGRTLTQVTAGVAGLSASTLSRLETGRLRPTLEQLLTLAQAYEVALDDLVGVAPPTLRRHGAVYTRLTNRPGGIQAYRVTAEGPDPAGPPQPCSHEGYQWLHVLRGRLRLVLDSQDLHLVEGEAAEFDTRVPHWMAHAGDGPLEMLVLFGRQGDRPTMRVRATRRQTPSAMRSA